jgi:hypothetical protein
LVAVDGDVDGKELSNALRSKKVAAGLRFLKLDLPGLGEQRLQVLDPKVDIEGGKVHINSWLVTAGAPKSSGVPLDLLATPQLEGERYVVLHDLKVNSDALVEPEQFSTFAQELFNPLVDFGRLDRFTHAIRFSKLEVADERVNFTGRLLLAPKPSKTPTFSAPFQAAQKPL